MPAIYAQEHEEISPSSGSYYILTPNLELTIAGFSSFEPCSKEPILASETDHHSKHLKIVPPSMNVTDYLKQRRAELISLRQTLLKVKDSGSGDDSVIRRIQFLDKQLSKVQWALYQKSSHAKKSRELTEKFAEAQQRMYKLVLELLARGNPNENSDPTAI